MVFVIIRMTRPSVIIRHKYSTSQRKKYDSTDARPCSSILGFQKVTVHVECSAWLKLNPDAPDVNSCMVEEISVDPT